MKLEICNFSGYKIYPGKGKLYIRGDSKVFRLLNGKCEAHFLGKLNPRKFHWTVVFRRMHKKGITEEAAKKKTRKTVKHQRAIVGASWDDIKKKRSQPLAEREAARAKAAQIAKEKKKAEEDKKKALKVKNLAAASRQQQKQQSKVPKAASKGNKPNKR